MLLILASVAISLTIGSNGIFTRAENAVDIWKEASENEEKELQNAEDFIDQYTNNKEDIKVSDVIGGDKFDTTTTIKDESGDDITIPGGFGIADDSGIEIEYLNGFPGVHTKRWMEGTDRQRNLAILDKLKGVPKEKRKITFITAIALTDGKDLITAEGKIDGYVSENIRGENGFGFDEIFELYDGRTLAELSSDEKNKISSRRKALEILKRKLASN